MPRPGPCSESWSYVAGTPGILQNVWFNSAVRHGWILHEGGFLMCASPDRVPVELSYVHFVQGYVFFGRPAPKIAHDVQICMEGGSGPGVVPVWGSVTFIVRPELLVLSPPGRDPFAVQTFRYTSSTGKPLIGGWCANCGYLSTFSIEQLNVAGWRGCPQCQSPPCEFPCPSWHAWGSCLRCRDNDSKIDGLLSDLQSEVRPPTAGSPATEHGPGPGQGFVDAPGVPVAPRPAVFLSTWLNGRVPC